MLLIAMSINAVPAKPGNWKSLKLADGTEVRARLCGDEFMHFWLADDGKRYVEGEERGVFYPADMEEMVRHANARRAKRQSARKARMRHFSENRTRYTGNRKGLIILVSYQNKDFQAGNDSLLFDRIVNEVGYSEGRFSGSVKDYFLAQSGGSFELDFDVVGPVVLSHDYSYYGRDLGAAGDDIRPERMLIEACQMVDPYVNFADYDWEGNGEVDQVFILYAGKGQADGGASDTVWPHEWTLTEAMGETISLDGVVIDTYACGSELNGTNRINGIGTICHEFSHCMGIMDMYDTNDTYNPNFGMGPWDIMDSGTYLGDGYKPCSYTSYEKMVCGWLDPIILKSDTAITAMQPLSMGGEAYIIYNDNHPDEYYMLENRQLLGWDASLYGAGLLVLHVDYDENIWQNNKINTTDFYNNHQRCTIFHADNADGYMSYNDLTGDPYPYVSKTGTVNNKLTATSIPAAKVYNANTDKSLFMRKSVTDITQNSDGTIAFNFSIDLQSDTTSTDTIPGGDYIFYESFDECAGKGGNDGIFSGNVASSAFIPDNEGWTGEKMFGGDQCAKFGTSSIMGVVTSPAFKLDGEAELSFKVATFGKDENSVDVYLGQTLLDTFTMGDGEWVTIDTDIQGNGNTFLMFIPARRFFLDEVMIKKKDADGIGSMIITRQQLNKRIYSIDGRYMGTDPSVLKPGLYIQDGRKIVRH